MKYCIVIFVFATICNGQKYSKSEYTTPVPILKQIDKHNEDGSYSYGYEAADGTFKIETKYPTGEVYGKYGYIDDRGTLREVEYGASKRGFEPAGNEIQVPPPTLRSDVDAIARPLAPNEEDDGQYREDPAAYYKNDPSLPKYSPPQSRNTYAPPPAPYVPPPAPYVPPYQSYAAPYNNYATSNYYAPTSHPSYPGWNQFQGHPAQNVDIFSGSYTVQYR